MPAYWSGTSVPSPIMRTNRQGESIGTSPGINPITPYTTAALDYRASWIAADMMAKTKATDYNIKSHLWSETLGNESRAHANSLSNPAQLSALPAPVRRTQYLETSGLERSLSTNIPDHPTAIQVNGLRQERTVNVICPGHVYGVNTFDTRTLVGNWAEERSDKSYVPSGYKAPTGRDWAWQTTYMAQAEHATDKVLPIKASNAETVFTHPRSELATGVKEESRSSNKEIVTLGGVPGVDYQPGDHRSTSRFSGNYVNYQCGKQHIMAQVGGKKNYLTPYETTSMGSFSDPAGKHVSSSSERCDIYKPPFQMRDPGRDGKSKMLCGIKKDEFACDRDDLEHMTAHVLGKPVPGKCKIYNLEEYRRKWTKSAPEIVAAGMQDTSEHRSMFQPHDLKVIDPTHKMAGHVGSWH